MTPTDFAHRQYRRNPPLSEADLSADPLEQFRRWLDDAVAAQMIEPTAMTLATCDAAGRPSARVVLMRGFHDGGFCFYTNYESRKGIELAANPRAALTFWWDRLERSVRVEGRAERLPEALSDAYFRDRPRRSSLGALASRQSRPLARRAELEARLVELERRYPRHVPRPPSWGGYRVIPQIVEFWQGREDRLHDRFVYRRSGDGWERQLLQP